MKPEVLINSKFPLGEIVTTRTLFEHCERNYFTLLPYLVKHAQGDWGEVCQEDKETKTPINWIVVARNGNKALLVSEYVLDSKTYNNE